MELKFDKILGLLREDDSAGGSSAFKGYYANKTALETAFPTATEGDYAIVGSTDTIWVWDSDTSAWKDSLFSTAGLVPYTGATADVDLGERSLKAETLQVGNSTLSPTGYTVLISRDSDHEAQFIMENADMAVNERLWDIWLSQYDGKLHFRTLNDANSDAGDWLTVERDGINVTSICYPMATTKVGIGKSNPAEALDITGNLKISGTISSDNELIGKQVSTPANPSAGYNKLYFKNDDKLYKLTSGGVESEVGGGGGGGRLFDRERVSGQLVSGTIGYQVAHAAGSIAGVKVTLLSLPTTANITVQVYKNGETSAHSIFTSDTPITIATNESATNGVYTVTKTTIDNGTFAENDVLYVGVTIDGTTLPGSDLSIVFY